MQYEVLSITTAQFKSTLKIHKIHEVAIYDIMFK